MTGQGHDRRLFAPFALHVLSSGNHITNNDGVVGSDLAVRGEQHALPDDQDVAWFAIDPIEKLEYGIYSGERVTDVIRLYGYFDHGLGALD
jgi:hypothetical protein